MSGLSSRILAVLALTTAFTVASGKTLYAQPLDTLLANADVAAGEKISHRCAMCHTFDKGDANKIGPNLWNIVGSFRAHVSGFNYSDALKSMNHEKWTYDALNLFIANPHKFAPGDKMPFAGIANEKERADLIAWMRTLSDNPAPLPAAK